LTDPPLARRFGLVQATALNMINVIGIGPFITIPLLMTALGGLAVRPRRGVADRRLRLPGLLRCLLHWISAFCTFVSALA
jgi:hypothetical protein